MHMRRRKQHRITREVCNIRNNKTILGKHSVSFSSLFMPVMSCLPYNDVSVRGVCNFLGSVLSQQKSEATDLCYSSQMSQCYSSVLWLRFIQKIKDNTSSRREGMLTQKARREEREHARGRDAEARGPVAPLFIRFVSQPWACCM